MAEANAKEGVLASHGKRRKKKERKKEKRKRRKNKIIGRTWHINGGEIYHYACIGKPRAGPTDRSIIHSCIWYTTCDLTFNYPVTGITSPSNLLLMKSTNFRCDPTRILQNCMAITHRKSGVWLQKCALNCHSVEYELGQLTTSAPDTIHNGTGRWNDIY